jgi:hypothetical protein
VILAMPRDVLFQRHRIVMLSIFRAKEQRDSSLPGCSREMFDLVALIIELRGVSLFEFLPSSRIVREPLSQPGAGCDFLEPFIDTGFSTFVLKRNRRRASARFILTRSGMFLCREEFSHLVPQSRD